VWAESNGIDYVYNGMTGALLRLPPGGKGAVERVVDDTTATGCSPAVLQKLAHGRMLVADDADEIGLLATRYALTRNDTSHFALTIVTSLGCNFDCPYCFEDKHPSIMGPKVRAAVLAALDDQLPRVRTFHVTWFGGEPLVGKKSLLELSDAFIARCDAAKVSYEASIVTNGYLLDEGTCRELAERRVRTAQVSIDGPAAIHDRMRPLVNGGPTFERIVGNLHHAVEHLQVSVRINVDTGNFPHAEELLRILADRGLSGRLTVYVGQIVGVNDGAASPSSTYRTPCFTNPEFAQAELEFEALAARYGFGRPTLPKPSGAPCTAVRGNELVVGSEGELYKCWDSVGNQYEVIGSIFDYQTPNTRRRKWLAYDPFADAECRSCIALPVCMGGCAHHAFDLLQRENRCGTFRHTYRQQVDAFVRAVEQDPTAPALVPAVELARRMSTR
jgi:uncharacterized protein